MSTLLALVSTLARERLAGDAYKRPGFPSGKQRGHWRQKKTAKKNKEQRGQDWEETGLAVAEERTAGCAEDAAQETAASLSMRTVPEGTGRSSCMWGGKKDAPRAPCSLSSYGSSSPSVI